ncbi:MAG: Sjogren's syndrome/scleroderma autoantigen 1 family protein [Candidatus Hodarchaeota archaeon]
MINENIKKMADLLRSGSTMLNMACPVCNNPIFRNRDGNTFCPTCNRKVLIVNDKNHQNNRNKISYNKKQEIDNQDKQIEILNLLKDVLFEKIEIITNKLKKENHLQLIETYTKILINCFDILMKIPIQKEKT